MRRARDPDFAIGFRAHRPSCGGIRYERDQLGRTKAVKSEHVRNPDVAVCVEEQRTWAVAGKTVDARVPVRRRIRRIRFLVRGGADVEPAQAHFLSRDGQRSIRSVENVVGRFVERQMRDDLPRPTDALISLEALLGIEVRDP